MTEISAVTSPHTTSTTQLPAIGEDFTDVLAHEVLNTEVPLGDIDSSGAQVSHKELPLRNIPSTGPQAHKFLNTEVPLREIPFPDVQTQDVHLAHVQAHQVHNTDVLLSDIPSSGFQTHEVPETHLNSDATPATDGRLHDFQTHQVTITESFNSDIPAHQVPVSHVPLTDAQALEKISSHGLEHRVHDISRHSEVPFTNVPNADAQADLVPETHVPAEIPLTGVPNTGAHAHGVSFNDGPSREASFTEVPVARLPTNVSPSKHHASSIPDIKIADTVRPSSDVLVGEIPAGAPIEDIQISEFSNTGLPISPETHIQWEPQNQPTPVITSFKVSSSSLSQGQHKEKEEPEAPVTEMSFTVSFKEASPVLSESNLHGGFLQPTPPSFSPESQQPLDQIVALQDPGQHLLGTPKRESKSLQGGFETDTTTETSLPGAIVANSPSGTFENLPSETENVNEGPLETKTKNLRSEAFKNKSPLPKDTETAAGEPLKTSKVFTVSEVSQEGSTDAALKMTISAESSASAQKPETNAHATQGTSETKDIGTIDSETDTIPLETSTATPEIYETTLGTTAATLEIRGAALGGTNMANPESIRVSQETKEFTQENTETFPETLKIVPEKEENVPENIIFTLENPETAMNRNSDGFEPVNTITTTTTTTKTSNANLLPTLQSKPTSESFSEPTSKSTADLFMTRKIGFKGAVFLNISTPKNTHPLDEAFLGVVGLFMVVV